MAAADQIVFRLPRDRLNERSSLTVVARFRDRATDADVTPANVKYRIDCISTGAEVLDWTSKTAATAVSIVITPDQNECKVRDDWQQMLLTVASDYGLASQFSQSLQYQVRNLGLGG